MGYVLHYGIGFNQVHSIYSIGLYVDMVSALTNLHLSLGHIWYWY